VTPVDYTGARRAIAQAKRLVVKIGSSSLTSLAGGLNVGLLEAFARSVGRAAATGREIIVVSSGAIAAGLEPMGLAARPKDLATQQAAAGVGQTQLMSAYRRVFDEFGTVTAQVLLTTDELIRRTQYRNAQRALDRMLALGVQPIVNENDAVATQEIRFGDNDRLSALVAQLAHADALVMLSDVDALYTAPPEVPGSARVPFVADAAATSGLRIGGTGRAGVGSGGMTSKVRAATMVADSGIPTVLTSAANLEGALTGADLGTYFGVTHKRRQTRLLWLAHLADTHGSVRVDAGAAKALHNGSSLLAAGVTDVDGAFEAGDPIDIVGPRGQLLARGMVNFAAVELPRMYGMSTDELGQAYGGDYRKEVVHRNDLVLTDAVF
jgi:glutamate 5-kinase